METGTSYVVSAIDIGNQLTLEVTSTVLGGSIARSFGTVAKAYYSGDTPAAPTRASRTTTKIVLKAVSGCEYSPQRHFLAGQHHLLRLEGRYVLYLLPALQGDHDDGSFADERRAEDVYILRLSG